MVGTAASGRRAACADGSRRQLRLECRARGLAVRGTVGELAARLRGSKITTAATKCTKKVLESIVVKQSGASARAVRATSKRALVQAAASRLRGKSVTMTELFSGIGGARLGALAAGVVPVSAVDFDSAANDMYEHNFGTRPLQTDVAEIDPRAHGTDIWWGSPPCQPFAKIGKKLGFGDPRARILLRLPGLAKLAKCKAVVLEESPMLLYLKQGKHWRRLVRAFADAGFSLQHMLLNARDYGVPQHRERLFVVALKSKRAPLLVAPPRVPNVTLSQALGVPLRTAFAHAVRTSYGQGPVSDGRNFATVVNTRGRPVNLSPEQLLRVQGFPRTFTFGMCAKVSVKRRLVGNAVPPQLAACVLAQVRRLLEQVRRPAKNDRRQVSA